MAKRTSATVFSIRIDDELLRLADLVARRGDETAELNRSRFFVNLARAEVERIVEHGRIRAMTNEVVRRGLDNKDLNNQLYEELAEMVSDVLKTDFIKTYFAGGVK
jgi:hypothetical protein